MGAIPQVSGRVLVVDDEAPLRRALTRVLKRLGLDVETAADGIEAQRLLVSSRFDLCLTDLRMPGADGFSVLKAARACSPAVPVVILTGHGTVTSAVEAMRAGALNFLTKPFNIEELEAVVCDALAPRPQGEGDGTETGTCREPGKAGPAPGFREETAATHASTRAGGVAAVFIGEHAKVRELLALVERIADTDSTVLITGESGTGKEVLARVIHATSTRAGQPFVALNCAAMPETLVESELFGHARGAFTGATEARKGRVALAEGGTLFLDEVGDLPLPMQAKLLRLLQEREYSPLGDARALRANIRIVAATNADLERRVAEGRFRADLYYRLNVISVELPPLRERKEDIPLLADHFLVQANRRLGRAVAGFAEGVVEALCRYPWPGNVRELENAIERAVALRREGLIGSGDLPPRILAALEHSRNVTEQAMPQGGASPPAGMDGTLPAGRVAEPHPREDAPVESSAGAVEEQPGSGPTNEPASCPDAPAGAGSPPTLRGAIEEVEDRMILEALRKTGGNKKRAAELLGMKRTTLIEKLKRKRLRLD